MMINAVRVAGISLLFAVVSLVAAPLRAQPALQPHGTFVDGFAAAVWDDTRSQGKNIGGAVPGYGMAFGFDSGTSGIEVTLQVPQSHARIEVLDRYVCGGQSYTCEDTESSRRRSIDVAVMYRINTVVNRHFTFALLLGGASVYRANYVGNPTREADGQLRNGNTYKDIDNYLAGAARADFEIRIMGNVAVVPRLQFLVFPSLLDESPSAPHMFVGRPEIAIRWRF
jgi:hypothetical protein